MYKLELDKNGIIRGKCSSGASIEQMMKIGWEGPFVSDEIGASIELPAEPVYKGKSIIGGIHLPDLMPPVVAEPKPQLTVTEKIASIEEELRILKESLKGEAIREVSNE